MSETAVILFQLFLVIVCARLAGQILRVFGQPPVMGEMISGILLGHSMLGRVAPEASALLFSPGPLRFLHQMSTVGVVLFMFLTGLRSSLEHMRSQAGAALTVSLACMAVPFVSGTLLALSLPAAWRGSASLSAFALFTGLALSITAFPVLARILQDQNATDSRIGVIALTAAAIGDAVAWILLPAVLSFGLASRRQSQSPWWIAAELAGYGFFMLSAGRKLIARLMPTDAGDAQTATAAAVLLALFSAGVTELIGVHAAFGAFLAGLAMPPDDRLKAAVSRAIEPVTMALLIPLFFAFTGQQTELFLSWQAGGGAALAPVLAIAVAGKIVPAVLAGKWLGFSLREAVGLGALMNTRGLVEVIILRIGLDEGLLPASIFAVMIGMTLLTTLMGPPLLAWSRSQRRG